MKNEFGADIEWFVTHVESIRRMLPPIVHGTLQITDRIEKDINKYIKDHATNIIFDEKKKIKQYELAVDYANRHRVLQRSYDDVGIFMNLLPKMALVTLISVFDAYLGKLIRNLLRTKPEILNSSNKQLTYAQLSEFASINDAREHVLEAEIESVLRESHTQHFEWLEAKLGIPLRKDLPSWPRFIEITERRNLFVHTDGIVGAQYLNICKRHDAPIEEGTVPGLKLHVTPKYFESAIDCIAEIGVKLGHVVWRKIVPSDLAIADENLISVSYELLLVHEYSLAETLLIFASKTLHRHASAEHSIIFKVNLAIAYKWCGKEDAYKELLDSVDWSALSDKFKLAEAVLRENYEKAADIMRRIGSTSQPSKTEYRDWPLFDKFRKREEFKKAYQEVFGEPFKLFHYASVKGEEKSPKSTAEITSDPT